MHILNATNSCNCFNRGFVQYSPSYQKKLRICGSYSRPLLTNDIPLGLVAQQIGKQESNKHFICAQFPKIGLDISHYVLLKLAQIKEPLYSRGC